MKKNSPTIFLVQAGLAFFLAVYSSAALADNLEHTVAQIDRARILKLASEAMKLKPPAITDDIAANSAGGPHDFFSQADYFWPNPTNKSGPYIGRDGETNPDNFERHRMAMRHMK